MCQFFFHTHMLRTIKCQLFSEESPPRTDEDIYAELRTVFSTLLNFLMTPVKYRDRQNLLALVQNVYHHTYNLVCLEAYKLQHPTHCAANIFSTIRNLLQEVATKLRVESGIDAGPPELFLAKYAAILAKYNNVIGPFRRKVTGVFERRETVRRTNSTVNEIRIELCTGEKLSWLASDYGFGDLQGKLVDVLSEVFQNSRKNGTARPTIKLDGTTEANWNFPLDGVIQRLISDASAYFEFKSAEHLFTKDGNYTIEYVRAVLELVNAEEFRLEEFLGSELVALNYVRLAKSADRITWNKWETVRKCVVGHEVGLASILKDSIVRKASSEVSEVCSLISPFDSAVGEITSRAISDLVSSTIRSSPENTNAAALVELHEQTSELLSSSFLATSDEHNSVFALCLTAHRSAWRSELLKLGKNISVRLGEYCNSVARNPAKYGDGLMPLFDKICRFSTIIPDCDLFMEVYTAGLAKRLISSGKSDPIEGEFVGKLRSACGKMLTSAAEAMLKDSTLWEGCRSPLKQPGGLEFCPIVCTHSMWPKLPMLQPSQETSWVPTQFAKLLGNFSAAYTKLHKSRKLEWAHSASTCSVDAKFCRGNKVLLCSFRQAVLLLTLDDTEILTAQTSQEAAIACSGLVRAKLLIPRETGGFSLNAEFSSKDTKVKIPFSSADTSISPEERCKMEKSLEMDRAAVTQACLTRIMKAKKTLSYEQLKVDAISQISARFTPDAYFVKKQFEELVDSNYIKRDESNPKVCHYIA